jgi:NTE family protein
MQVLEAAGYRADYFAGSSVGSWVAAGFAQGLDSATVLRRLRAAFSPELLEKLVGGPRADSSDDALFEAASLMTGGCTFEELSTPLVIVAADLVSRRSVELDSGPVDRALVAALAMTGIHPPVEVDGMRLVDAVALTPVPTQSLIARGVPVTIAINVLGREVLPSWADDDSRPVDASPPGATDQNLMLQVVEMVQMESAARQVELATVPVTPRFGPGSWRDYALAGRFLSAGIAAGREALPRLKAHTAPTAGAHA